MELEDIAEAQKRNRRFAKGQDLAPLNCANVGGLDAERLFDRRQGNREVLS